MDKLVTLLTISEAAKSAEDLSESQPRKLCADGWLRSTRRPAPRHPRRRPDGFPEGPR
jgi:hypothetical protein